MPPLFPWLMRDFGLSFTGPPVCVLAIAGAAGWRAAGVGASIVGMLALAFLILSRRVLEDQAIAQAQEAARRRGGSFGFLGVGAVWMCFFFFLVVVMAF